MFVFYFMYLFMNTLCGMWGLSSSTSDRTEMLCSVNAESDDWTLMEAPDVRFKKWY